MISQLDSTLTLTIANLKVVFPYTAIYARVEIKARLTILTVKAIPAS